MFKKVLIPLDGSRLAARILLPLRRLLEPGAEVTLLRVVEPPSPAEHDRAPAAEVAMRAQLAQVQETLGLDVRSRVQLLRGDAAEEIVRYAGETEQELVAMSTHGRSGVERWVRGSIAERVLRHCEAPLLLCNPLALGTRDEGPFRRILVPLDGSDRAERILALVEPLARAQDARVTLLRVEPMVVTEVPSPLLEGSLWDPAPLTASLAPARERLEAAGVPADATAAYGVVAAEILHAAKDADLLAMTTHGRSGVPRWWFGSVAEQVLRHATCPLLVLRTAHAAVAQPR
jgi:nucleotide-binding universal stress UspA family protein